MMVAEMAEYAFSARSSSVCFSFAMVAGMPSFAASDRIRKVVGILMLAEMTEYAFSARAGSVFSFVMVVEMEE